MPKHMSTTPSVSIITPVWNGLPYIKECVDSVLLQDFHNWELIISDDGSTDGTLAYLDTLTDPRIRVIKQKRSLGTMGNVNFLFTQAKSPITQILCAKDYFINHNSISEIVIYWNQAAPDVGFVTFNHYWKSKDLISDMDAQIMPEVIPKGSANLWYFIFGNVAGHLSNVSIRTHLVHTLGNFDESISAAGDFEFWSRAALSVSMGVQKTYITCVRQVPNTPLADLGLKGALYIEHVLIYEKLIRQLLPFYNKEQLIDFFNYEICSFHFRNALKSALLGRFSYLRKIMNTRSSILWPKWQQLIFCTSFAFINRRRQYTYPMAIKMLQQKQQPESRTRLHYEFNNS
jgi:glycosyltransferase involved in cell wall biosynthesis